MYLWDFDRHSPKDLSSHQPYNNCWAPETWLSANDLTSRHIQHTFLRCFNQSVWWNNGKECVRNNMLGEANRWISRVLSALDDQAGSHVFSQAPIKTTCFDLNFLWGITRHSHWNRTSCNVMEMGAKTSKLGPPEILAGEGVWGSPTKNVTQVPGTGKLPENRCICLFEFITI